MIKKKNIHILNLHSDATPFAPLLWPSAKTYYEINGRHSDKFNWVLPIAEFHIDIETIKKEIAKYPPDIFGVSLYVWNFELSLEVCQWVKETYPNCIVVTGGPHQYFKYRDDWFKLHPFIDASLPSEVYGELAICDMLDYYIENDVVDWNKIEQMVYPSADRHTCVSSTKSTHKRLFQWNYSAYEAQASHMLDYVTEYYKTQTLQLMWKLETTRGCPYSCTYCDWGGGIGGKTVFKNIDCVKQDIDVITQHDCSSIFVCDANFGIGGERDVEVMQYIADKKKEAESSVSIFYGGLAKTNKHFDSIRKILEIEASNQMSYFYKISIQTFNSEILQNIKRTDLRKEEHWELEQFLRKQYGYGSQIELILGLPGITFDTWCEEFSEAYQRDIQVMVYEWHLLPESEAYDPKYREKFSVKTSKKLLSNSEWHFPAEIVVSTNSYTPEDYKLMWMIYSIYVLFYRGGIYRNVIQEIQNKHQLTFGQILKKFLFEVYPLLRETNLESYGAFENHLDNLVDLDSVNDYKVVLTSDFNNHKNQELYLHSFFLVEYFTNFDIIDPIVCEWFSNLGVNKKTIHKDNMMIIAESRLQTKKREWFRLYRYNRYKDFQDYISELETTVYYYPGALLNNPELLLKQDNL